MFGPLRWLTLLALLLCGGAGHSASSEERRKEVWVRECVNYTAGFKEHMNLGLKWLGGQLGLAHCSMPQDRVRAVRCALTDPVWGVIGQHAAVDHIIRRYQHHTYNPAGTLALFLFGHRGVGKTFTSDTVGHSLYQTPTENGRQGYVNFVGGDYEDKDFYNVFKKRLTAARQACGTKADRSNPVTVFFDEFHQLVHSAHAKPIAAKIVDALKDAKLSLDGDEVLDVRGWVFIFATDVNEKSVGGRAFREFTTRWVNSEIDVEPLATAYRQDLSELMVLLTQQHREEFEILQFGAGIMADDIVVFMPYGYRWARRLLDAMVEQANQREGFDGRVALTTVLVDYIIDDEVKYDTVTASCSGDDPWGSCSAGKAEKVVRDGGSAVRRYWNAYRDAILDVALPLRKEKDFWGNPAFKEGQHFVAGLGMDKDAKRPHLLVCQITEPDEQARKVAIAKYSADIQACPEYALLRGKTFRMQL